MKNRFQPLRILNLIIILVLIAGYQHVALGRAELEAEALEAARAAEAEQKAAAGVQAQIYNDGTYTGSAEGYGGTITVEVIIENDVIQEINAISHSGEDAAYWSMASGMLGEMVSAQSPNVDNVTGATMTSVGIHNAVTIALKQALKQ